MRAVIDCRYVRERPSGIGAYVEALVELLPQLARTDQFVLWTHRLAPRPLANARNVSEITIPVEPNSLWTLWWPERYASFSGADVFHAAHNTLPHNLRCATVVTIHDLLAIDHPRLAFTRLSQRMKRLYYPQAQWKALQHATRLIATTSVMADRIIELCPSARNRTAVVPMAAGAPFRPSADADLGRSRVAQVVGSDAPYFLVVGQHSPTKKHAIALQAFARNAPKPWRLVLLQRQTHAHPLAALARRLNIDERVTWLSHVKPDDLVALYQNATALIQPSSYEGFGLPVVEAMACGCPVIVSDIPTLREVVGDAGIFALPGDVPAFSEALARFAQSPALQREYSLAGIERAKTFSWKRCARETLEVLREAADLPPASLDRGQDGREKSHEVRREMALP